ANIEDSWDLGRYNAVTRRYILKAMSVCVRWSSGQVRAYRGGVVLLVSSFLVTVPSGDSVTVFSFDLTVPSLLTLVLLVFEISRAHPTIRNDNARTDAARVITLGFFILCSIFHFTDLSVFLRQARAVPGLAFQCRFSFL